MVNTEKNILFRFYIFHYPKVLCHMVFVKCYARKSVTVYHKMKTFPFHYKSSFLFQSKRNIKGEQWRCMISQFLRQNVCLYRVGKENKHFRVRGEEWFSCLISLFCLDFIFIGMYLRGDRLIVPSGWTPLRRN